MPDANLKEVFSVVSAIYDASDIKSSNICRPDSPKDMARSDRAAEMLDQSVELNEDRVSAALRWNPQLRSPVLPSSQLQ
jgi:hypothetical protein